MDKVLLLIISASGLCAVSSRVTRRYHFVYELKNMTEAQSYCRERYTDLATIDNMEDVNILNNMADLSKIFNLTNSYVAWIGLYDDVNSWRWSLADKLFYTDGGAEFRNWETNQPDNFRSGQYCVSFIDGVWYDYTCESPFQSVCFDVRGSNVTFVLTNNSMTWTEAQSYCREHHTDLASVRNMAENQKVKELVPTGLEVWIGLFRDSWKWLDGSNSSFRYWTSGEPNNNEKEEACVSADFTSSGNWSDWNCYWKRAFICYSPPKTKQVIRLSLLKKNSSLDLNDPAVMEEVLNQLQQKLKEQGVNPNIKLSWRKQSDGKVFHKDEEETKKRKASSK